MGKPLTRSDHRDRSHREARERSLSCAQPQFFAPDGAPFNQSLQVQIGDGWGAYVPPFPCMRTNKGWVNANSGHPLAVTVTGWRHRSFG